jgi:hypothetical protein
VSLTCWDQITADEATPAPGAENASENMFKGIATSLTGLNSRIPMWAAVPAPLGLPVPISTLIMSKSDLEPNSLLPNANSFQ